MEMAVKALETYGEDITQYSWQCGRCLDFISKRNMVGIITIPAQGITYNACFRCVNTQGISPHA